MIMIKNLHFLWSIIYLERLSQLEKEMMAEYKSSGTTNAEFKVDFVGWTAEHVLMKGDKIKKKGSS
jgi:hypothetical protein